MIATAHYLHLLTCVCKILGSVSHHLLCPMSVHNVYYGGAEQYTSTIQGVTPLSTLTLASFPGSLIFSTHTRKEGEPNTRNHVRDVKHRTMVELW